MAEVDFSNAIIEPSSYTIPGVTYESINPTYRRGIALSPGSTVDFYNANFGTIATSVNVSVITDQSKQLLLQYQGTFTANGTEFYIVDYSGSGYVLTCWRVSNISFNNGDTFLFKVRADLICE